MNTSIRNRTMLLVAAMLIITAASLRLHADTGTCGGVSTTVPFTDVMSSPFFCQIAEAFFSGLTNGTSATTYSPSANVPREQMAAFITRTLDQSLRRGSPRAALNQFWTSTPHFVNGVGVTNLSGTLRLVQSDGADLWVANFSDGTVSRVRASDGKLLETWTGATNAFGVVVAAGHVFITGRSNPTGSLYVISPADPPGTVTTLPGGLGSNPSGIAFDGDKVWTANVATGPGTGSVSIFSIPGLTVSTVSSGLSQPLGVVYDGANIWVTDIGDSKLKKLDSTGTVVQAISVDSAPQFPAFDGANIWVPSIISNTVTVVRASTGVILATLSGNGLDSPRSVAFDGERILVTNSNSAGNLSLWKASDLTPIGFMPAGSSTDPFGACSDGLNFWITLNGSSRLARF